ncbi:MAG: TerB family tellurite resistance protein [Rhodocyclales bacterium]|nr:TerB family tellurite resistance protein [Rhodocyclales bacterium]
MLDRVIKLLSGDLEPGGQDYGPFQRRFVAAAVLLVEASQFDSGSKDENRRRIIDFMQSMFHFRQEVAAQVLELAELRFANTLDDWVFAEAVRSGFSAVEREELLAMLWELVYHDGRLLRLEAQLMEKLADELGLLPDAAESARMVALARSSQVRERDAED